MLNLNNVCLTCFNVCTHPVIECFEKAVGKGACVTLLLCIGTSQLYELVDLVGPKAGLDIMTHAPMAAKC
jgi:hypothetical protein